MEDGRDPDSSLRLEILRFSETARIPPSPVMAGPFERREVAVRRQLAPHDAPATPVTGLGLLFHKVASLSLSRFSPPGPSSSAISLAGEEQAVEGPPGIERQRETEREG